MFLLQHALNIITLMHFYIFLEHGHSIEEIDDKGYTYVSLPTYIE